MFLQPNRYSTHSKFVTQVPNAPVTEDKPLQHRPCVVEKRVKGKVLRTYGTLLDPRTNPRYLQKYGYTDVE